MKGSRWRQILAMLVLTAVLAALGVLAALEWTDAPASSPRRDLAPLRRDLDSPDPRVRQQAAEELGRRFQEDSP